jgi:hypothetical protein
MAHVHVENHGVWRIIGFWAQHFVFGIGCILVVLGAYIAYHGAPPATAQQDAVLKTMVALGAGCVAAEIPGLINLQLGRWFTGAGAIAVFAIVFWGWPHFG